MRLLNSGTLSSITEDGVYSSKENENKCCFQRNNTCMFIIETQTPKGDTGTRSTKLVHTDVQPSLLRHVRIHVKCQKIKTGKNESSKKIINDLFSGLDSPNWKNIHMVTSEN